MKKLLITIFLISLFSPTLSFAAKVSPKRILIVPGHDNEIWGSQYENLKEADMNLALATKIFNLLKKDKRFKVWITRNDLGYTPEFANYFSIHKNDILAFERKSKEELQSKINNGSFIKKTEVVHNKVTEDTAVKLYGINKWADENNMDAVIHIHFNDYPRDNNLEVGKYKGFTVYKPEEQMVNSLESTNLAKKIYKELAKKYAPSNYEKESNGFVSDQNLIALGSNGTLIKKVKSVLIEYGYIYRFGNSTLRKKTYQNMANLTVSGIKKYFLK